MHSGSILRLLYIFATLMNFVTSYRTNPRTNRNRFLLPTSPTSFVLVLFFCLCFFTACIFFCQQYCFLSFQVLDASFLWNVKAPLCSLFTFFSNLVRVRVVLVLADVVTSSSIFPHTGPQVPHSRSVQKRECGIFGIGVRKNSIRSTGLKLVSPHVMFATLAFGSGGN